MPKPTYRLFTVSSGVVTPGIIVGKLTLKGAGKDIPAILVGQEGRGRKQDAIPVNLPDNLYREWQKEGTVKIVAAALGKTHSKRWKLFVGDEVDTEDEVICVFRTKFGFRGGNAHTGDHAGWECSSQGCIACGGCVGDHVHRAGALGGRNKLG